MVVFQKPKKLFYDTETLTEFYGHFHAQPFESGFGTTIGNSLRRIMFSSIEGAAITAVKIEGILHEFSSITGVKEDVTDIVMNLKKIPIRLLVERPKTLYLDSEKGGILTAGDIKPDPDVEIMDPSIHIATVSDEANLKMEMRVKSGSGYVSADNNFDDDMSVGYIPFDSVHSPVRKVNFNVEAARLGQLTDYDRLNLEIWTNGCIAPQDAVASAAKILKDHLYIFIDFEEKDEVVIEEKDPEMQIVNENLNRSVDELELSVRSYNCLRNANIRTIGQLIAKTETEMLKTKNFGNKSLNEIKRILSSIGLSFGMTLDDEGKSVQRETMEI